MDPPAAVPTAAPSNENNPQNLPLPAVGIDTFGSPTTNQTTIFVDNRIRDPLQGEEEESKNSDQESQTTPDSSGSLVIAMPEIASIFQQLLEESDKKTKALLAQLQSRLEFRLDASNKRKSSDSTVTKLDEITVTVQALQQAVDLQGDKQCDLEAHFVQDAQRIAVIEHVRQEANQQPEPAIDLQLEMIYAVESPSTFSSPVFAKNPMRDAAVAIAKTEPPNISDERAELFSTSIPSPEVLSNDICAIQQCYDEDKFMLSFPHVSNEPHEPGRILQPCLDTAATAVLINAELFNVVSSSAMWDPGGQSSFRPLRARPNNNRRRREKDTSFVWLFPPRQQACETLGQQGRGTTHSE